MSFRALHIISFVLIILPSVLRAESLEPVTAPEVKRILQDNPNAVLVHALSQLEFNIQHIPGSINIPTNEMESTQSLPTNKATELVFYCMGERCKYSYRSALKAIDMGYTRVHWFKGGIPEWRKYDYPMYVDEEMNKIQVNKLRTHEVFALLEHDNAFTLDVRPFWWDGIQKYIRDSLNLPLLELAKHLDVLPKDRPIIIVDGFMKQSVSAAKFLSSKGYDIAGVLRGGMKKWELAEMPVVPRSEIVVFDPELCEFVKGEDIVGVK